MMYMLLVIAIIQPFTFQKEHAAEKLMMHLGEQYLTPSSQDFLTHANCNVEPKEKGFPYTPILCSYETSCGITMERIVWHRPFYGAFTSAEPISWNIAETCPQMLKDDIRKDMLEGMKQGE